MRQITFWTVLQHAEQKVLNEEKHDDTDASLGTSLGKHLACLAQPLGVTTSSPLNAIKSLYLHPCKTTDNLYWLYAGEVDPKLVLLNDEPSLYLSGWLILRITDTGLHNTPQNTVYVMLRFVCSVTIETRIKGAILPRPEVTLICNTRVETPFSNTCLILENMCFFFSKIMQHITSQIMSSIF